MPTSSAPTAPGLFDAQLPIAGMAGDQQAALFGQACFEPGMVKSTYGTGCFMLVNTGEQPVASRHRLLTTPAYRLAGMTTYALEGSIFVAGAAVKWLRDGLGVIADAAETDSLATRVPDSHRVYLVPAFVGLGAPHWDPDARAAIFGLTLDATAAHLARAALEAVAYQTLDLLEAMAGDGARPSAVRIDGGMTANEWLCQFLADMLQLLSNGRGTWKRRRSARLSWQDWQQASGQTSTRWPPPGSAAISSRRHYRPIAATSWSQAGERPSQGRYRTDSEDLNLPLPAGQPGR